MHEAASLLTDVAHSVTHGRLVRAENRVRSQGLLVAVLLDLTYYDHPELTSCAVELLVRQF